MSRITSLAALGLVVFFGAACSSENTADDDDDDNSVEKAATGGAKGSNGGSVIANSSGGASQGTNTGTGVTGGSTGSSSSSSGGRAPTGGFGPSSSGGTTATNTGGGKATTGGGTGVGANGSGVGGAAASGGNTGVGGDGDGGVPSTCEYREGTTQSSPAILQFVIDKSTSMNTVIGSTNGRTKWQATRDALNGAYAGMDPSLAVGENFFPNASGGCVDTSGGVNPAPLGAAQVSALQSAVNAIPDPTNITGTPTHDGWREGLRRLQAMLAAPPAGYESSQGYIVLVTDGMPVRTLNCGQADGDNIAVTELQFNQIIDEVAATTAATGIKTFVIGVPGSEDTSQVPTDPSGSGLDYIPRQKLSELAQWGGTASDGCDNSGTPQYCHFDLVNNPDFSQALQDAVASVVASLVSCSYPVVYDPAAADWVIDMEQLQVNYYSGGSPTLLTRTDCATSSEGWQLSADGAEINLCPDTCVAVQADSSAEIRIDYGCIQVK